MQSLAHAAAGPNTSAPMGLWPVSPSFVAAPVAGSIV
jgi:hypothetical protein